jgi:hypothetical protein
MTTVMSFPRTRPQQAASINSLQTGVQQTNGVDISTLLNLLVPVMMVAMMTKMMSGMFGKRDKAVTPTATSTSKKGK